MKPLDLAAIAKAPAPSLDFILPGFLRGTVGGLLSPGGVGKSFWALQLALDMVNAKIPNRMVNLTGTNPAYGHVIYFGLEDPEVVIGSRIRSLGSILPKNATFQGLSFFALNGQKSHRNIEFLGNLVKSAVMPDTKLVVIDTFSRCHDKDENSNRDMREVLSQLEDIAATHNVGILIVHHVTKNSVLQGTATLAQAGRGASVLTDNLRWVSYLSPMTEAEAKHLGVSAEGHLKWNVSKQNYGPPLPDFWYRRSESGVLTPTTLLAKGKLASGTEQSEPQAIVQVVEPEMPKAAVIAAVDPLDSSNKHGRRAARSPAPPTPVPATRRGYPRGGSPTDW